MGATTTGGATAAPGIVPERATAVGRATVAGRGIRVGRVIGAGQAIAADRVSPIAADRARAIAAAPVTAGVRASPIAADPVRAAATMRSRAPAVAPLRNATWTGAARAINRWRQIAAAPAPVQARVQALVRAQARAQVAAAEVRAAVAVAVVAVAAAAAGAKGDPGMRSTLQQFRGSVTAYAASLAVAAALFVAATPAAFAQQKAFASPEAAMNAFGDAIATSDDDAVKALLGADYHTLIPPVGAEGRYRFLAAWAKSHSIKAEGDAKAHVAVGTDGWTLPIPIVKTAQGWRFDTKAGADEMRLRRIGRNELAVMQVMLAIYDAQKEYARVDRNRDGVLQYAAKFRSAPGKQDGLYWPTKAGRAREPARTCLRRSARGGWRRRCRATTATATSCSRRRARTRPAARTTTSRAAG